MNTKNTSFYRSTALVLCLLLVSKFLGFLRNAVIAVMVGANVSTDLYFISSEFTINISGAITQALVTSIVTVFVAAKARSGRKAANTMASRSIALVTMGSAVLSLLILIFAGPISSMLAPGYSGDEMRQLVTYVRLFSFEVMITAAQAGFVAVLNAEHNFIPGRMYGLIFNPLAIAAVMLLGRRLGIGVLVAVTYAAQLMQLFMLVFVSRPVLRFRPERPLLDPDVRQFLLLALPVTLCNVIMQGSIIGGKAICSLLGESIASSYSYAYSLEQMVTGTFTAALTVTAFPRLAELAALEDHRELSVFLKQVLTLGVAFLLLVTLVMILSARDVVAIVYEHGAFTQENARNTAMALCGFAVGFPLVMCRELLRQVHFTSHAAKTIMITDLSSVAVCILLAALLSRPLGILGVAGAVSLGALFTVVFLSWSALERLKLPPFGPGMRDLLKCLAALILGGLAAFLVRHQISGLIPRFLLGVIVCVLVFAAALLLLRPDSLQLILEPLTARFQKKNP